VKRKIESKIFMVWVWVLQVLYLKFIGRLRVKDEEIEQAIRMLGL